MWPCMKGALCASVWLNLRGRSLQSYTALGGASPQGLVDGKTTVTLTCPSQVDRAIEGVQNTIRFRAFLAAARERRPFARRHRHQGSG